MPTKLHPTLKYQLNEYLNLKNITKLDDSLKNFILAINSTYLHNEKTNKLTEHTLEISTKELTKSNQQLQERIIQYNKREIENERLTKVMIGRELKMLELKKEIVGLKTEISNIKK